MIKTFFIEDENYTSIPRDLAVYIAGPTTNWESCSYKRMNLERWREAISSQRIIWEFIPNHAAMLKFTKGEAVHFIWGGGAI